MSVRIEWPNHVNLNSKSYTCGYCGEFISSEKGFYSNIKIDHNTRSFGFVYICHSCHKPTFFDIEGRQSPGAVFGNVVKNISDQGVETLYDEARRCYSVGGFTSAVLACRKLLMHIAVSKGAKENLNFIQYVEYLSDNNFIPPGSKDWVDHIRDKGNEANHEIKIMEEEEAKDLISFMEMLLKIIYEFPANIKNKKLVAK